jgi:hypothetical protein
MPGPTSAGTAMPPIVEGSAAADAEAAAQTAAPAQAEAAKDATLLSRFRSGYR